MIKRNVFSETDFPYLSSKPSGKRADKGRRSGAERVAARTLADQATVVKTIHDPQNVLGKVISALKLLIYDVHLASQG